jgi:hypothetical protein
MTGREKAAVVLGAASPIGAALALAVDPSEYGLLILAAEAADEPVLVALSKRVRCPVSKIRFAALDIAKPFAGIENTLLKETFDLTTDIFHAAHCMDRSTSASDLHPLNALMLERVFSIAYTVKHLGIVSVITDVGLVGDYPGRFSETWTDVGQTPFDDVDKSSLQAERICMEEKGLPIMRWRTGLTLLPKVASDLLDRKYVTSDVLLGSVRWLSKLPRFVTLPAAVAEGSFAPITPSDWAAAAILHLVRERNGVGEARHLIIDPKPRMQSVLDAAAESLGGARIRGGLPTDAIATLGKIPGFREIARRNADQVSAWFTPHRYCLSRNDLDTSRLTAVLPPSLKAPTWAEVRSDFRGN